MKLYAYNQGSKSAKALADALGIKRIKHEGKALKFNDILINWGASNIKREIEAKRCLNRPHAVAIAANKLLTFNKLKEDGVSIPEYTTDNRVALKWFQEGQDVMARHKLNGHSGEGIELLQQGNLISEQFGDAPLYTKYVKKEDEYRIHVMNGEAHFFQRKARKKDVPDDKVNWKVRNLAGGFIFANEGVEVDDIAIAQACAAVAAVGLDFGAVDIIRTRRGEWFVLEINTACGLEGKNLESYVQNFKKFL